MGILNLHRHYQDNDAIVSPFRDTSHYDHPGTAQDPTPSLTPESFVSGRMMRAIAIRQALGLDWLDLLKEDWKEKSDLQKIHATPTGPDRKDYNRKRYRENAEFRERCKAKARERSRQKKLTEKEREERKEYYRQWYARRKQQAA